MVNKIKRNNYIFFSSYIYLRWNITFNEKKGSILSIFKKHKKFQNLHSHPRVLKNVDKTHQKLT